jgi:hypothetical protein
VGLAAGGLCVVYQCRLCPVWQCRLPDHHTLTLAFLINSTEAGILPCGNGTLHAMLVVHARARIRLVRVFLSQHFKSGVSSSIVPSRGCLRLSPPKKNHSTRWQTQRS